MADSIAGSGKYTLLLMAAGGDDEEAAAMEEKLDDLAKSAVPRNVAKSKLDKTVQEVVSLIFDHNMFKEQMSKLEIDTKKMPLGQLSPQQLLLGYNTLEKLEDAIENGNRSAVEQLTSQFYTQIPHSFGRTKPPVLSSKEDVQRKYDMLNILSDIATTTKSEKDTKTKSKNGVLCGVGVVCTYSQGCGRQRRSSPTRWTSRTRRWTAT